MKASDVLTQIRQALQETKEQGHTVFSIDAMENYLKIFNTHLENDSFHKSEKYEFELAKFKAENDRNIANSTNETAHSVEMFKSVINAGQSALKASMVINGGGAAALLAFTGKIWETTTSALVANSLTCSILLFCLGVLCAALATGTTYLSQCAYSGNWSKTGDYFNVVSISAILGSYTLFGYGAFRAASSLGVHFGL
ncbi:hypothetical protein SAMN05660691_03959 [Rheinheimera pacifica]|uniref:Uncharacterized protein n=1 Tax=Rheinheimera pacifica TaxID=173990 RepID=A0A1H6NMG6_9GAMM|nr:hypothetical protein [Rheinheimera pacifica]SEI12452.1 hypothetical protein SAMN05660691_03959 [Rheinheimera pacifica]